MRLSSYHNACFTNKYGELLGRIDSSDEFAFIDSLIVQKWRQGYGRELLKKFEESAIKSGKTGVFIEVYCRNTNAIGFWRHQGYKTTGAYSHEYIKMYKQLS